MTDRFRITLAQLNPVVGDLEGNADKARAAWQAGREAGADLVALPEMFVTGYPVGDLVLKPAFASAAMEAIETLAGDCAEGPALGIGGPYVEGGRLYDAYWICQGGRVTARVLKHVFSKDEAGVFDAGAISGPVSVGPVRIGVPIGEDAWHEDVAEAQAESGAEILLVPSASPYHRGKQDTRLGHTVARVVETGLPLVHLNMVGGQDELVFDGASFVLSPGGALARQMPFCGEEIADVDFTRTEEGWRAEEGARAPLPDEWEGDYRVMVEALRDYVGKSGFDKVVLGLSGGVDSALVAAIAADAVGSENVRCVLLPSASSRGVRDAVEVARRSGCRLDEVAMEGPHQAMRAALAPLLGAHADATVQSRLHGVALMALSDTFGEMLLAACNKSEAAVGAATVNGEGDYNPVKDLYKSRVVQICRWRNGNHRPWMKGSDGEVIPPSVIEEPPAAGQRDEGSLPPDEQLDDILERLIDRDASIADIVGRRHDRETVQKIEGLIHRAEYKRHQAAPGPRLTPRGFRRYPVVNRWRDPS